MGNLMQTILRTLFFWIDSAVYQIIGKVYGLLTDIAETTIISEDLIAEFGSRIYALLGIFMLFKVSFSILTYIVNPDDFLDKNKGFGKLVGNIMISLVLLIATPMIFSKAFELQRVIIRDNVISNLILGSGDSISSGAGNLNPGRTMGYETFKAFYYLDTDVYEGCKGIYGEPEGVVFDEAACKAEFKDKESDVANMIKNISYSNRTKSVSLYLDWNLLHAKDTNDEFIMSYTPLISTIAGVVIALILITFCFDIAVRSIKLGFLQMIAPIPIISRVDPKSGKDGMFSKWLKECTKTYLDLFIRLLAIYFAVFVITNISLKSTNVITGSTQNIDGWVKVFIILGALLFAKALPQLIQDLTGFKMDGKFTINPMNKLRQVPIAGAAVTTATAMAGGAITGGLAGAQAGKPFRGMWQGMMGAGRDIKGKVPLMGDTSGKNPKAFSSGLQAGHKTITGKDFEIWSPWKEIGKGKGEEKVNELKDNKYTLQAEQAKLEAELQAQYDQYNKETDVAKRNQIMSDIQANREKYGKISKHIAVIDDQIKDFKRLYALDDSPAEELEKAKAEAKRIENENAQRSSNATNQSTSSNQSSTRVKVKPVTRQRSKK